MAVRTKTQFKALYGTTGTLFPDNTTQEISEADVRAFGEDIADSFVDETDNLTLTEVLTEGNNAGALQIKNIADGSDPQDAVSKAQLDAAALGIVTSWKAPVRLKTTGNVTLSGEQTIDGFLTSTDDVLVGTNSAQSENGIYTTAAGAWTRRADANTAAELEGAAVTVQEGTANANTTWIQTTDAINLGVSNIVFAQLGTAVPDADATTKGIAKLYTTTGSNTDGSMDQNSITAGLPTREFDRAFSSELLFDKNEIAYTEHVLTGDLEYTVAASGHLSNQFSSATQIVETDGTRTVTFTGFNFVLGDIQSGAMPEAGTYLVLFLYWNGIATINWTQPSLEVANLTPLTAPANFAAVPGAGDPETEVDLSWTSVANASSYELQYSSTGGGGPWIALATPASGDSTYTHTGLTANTTYHYRLRAIGDGIAFSSSAYSVDATTTEDAGDVTAPTFIFSPADAATDIPMNGVVTITASEALIDDDGVTVITDANVANYLVVKEDNGAGANIPFTATIDSSKTLITITPNVVWPALGDVFIQIDGVEDINGNESVADDATFTVNDFTLMNVNYLNLGDQFDAIVTGNDINFELEYEFKDAVFSGTRGLFQKQNISNNKSLLFQTEGEDVSFIFYQSGSGTSSRKLLWTGALTGITDGKITLKYFGAIDTNNGLDRADLYLDDVLVGSKTLIASGGAVWPFAIAAGNASFYISGPTFREVKNAFIRNNSGATVQGQYPVIRTGEDTSGNNRDGTWV